MTWSLSLMVLNRIVVIKRTVSVSASISVFALHQPLIRYKALIINVLSPKQATVVFLVFIRLQVHFPTSIIHKIIIKQMCVFRYLAQITPRCYVESFRQPFCPDCTLSKIAASFIISLLIARLQGNIFDELPVTNFMCRRVLKTLFWYLSLIKTSLCSVHDHLLN